MLRPILIGTVLAVGLTLTTTAPTFAAPASCPAIGQAAASMSTVMVHMDRTAWPLPCLALLVREFT
jgi:hypothetical protein